jgi:hypothetical protein
MKIRHIISLSAALLMSQLALAKMPFSNDIFGKLESTLDYCARLDPPSAAKYQEKKKAAVKDVPEEELAQARKSKEYKTSYEEFTDELSKMPKEEVTSACAAALESKN